MPGNCDIINSHVPQQPTPINAKKEKNADDMLPSIFNPDDLILGIPSWRGMLLL
jgi:hypothetical protein